MNSLKLFPTSVYFTKLSRNVNRLNRELLKECYQLRTVDRAGNKWCKKNYPGGYTSYHSYSNLHQMSSTFMELEKLIRKHCLKFTKELQYDLSGKTLVMTDCWVNIMPPGVIHPMHLHPLSTISGTYYVAAPKGTSSITFEDPRLSKFMAQPARIPKPRPENQYYRSFTPESGKLILFESWLRHQVGANPVKKDRISISFNYHWQ